MKPKSSPNLSKKIIRQRFVKASNTTSKMNGAVSQTGLWNTSATRWEICIFREREREITFTYCKVWLGTSFWQAHLLWRDIYCETSILAFYSQHQNGMPRSVGCLGEFWRWCRISMLHSQQHWCRRQQRRWQWWWMRWPWREGHGATNSSWTSSTDLLVALVPCWFLQNQGPKV